MPHPDSFDPRITQILSTLKEGEDNRASEELLPLVYDELKKLAGSAFQTEKSNHTLQPTALVHEAWMKVAGDLEDLNCRRHFFGVAARAMRQVLIDHARKRNRQKRGGDRDRVEIELEERIADDKDQDLLLMDDAITRLGEINATQAKIAEMRVFVGLTIDEVANSMGMSRHVVAEEWRNAKKWLQGVLGE